MIKSYSLKALEFAINKTLALDPSASLRLAPLENKIIHVIVNPLKVDFYITISNQTLCLLAENTQKVDTTITSNPLGLIRLSLLPASKARSLFNDKIKIEGDLEAGMALKQVFDDLDLDWEGHLAQFTGDVVAHQVGNLFRKGRAFTRQLSGSAQEQINDYLHEELRAAPPNEELQDFFHDVDALVLRVDRLWAHIQQEVKAP